LGTPNLTSINADVEKGLSSQSHRLNAAAMAQGFWDYSGKQFMSVFMRDAETPFDYVQRQYRMSGLCRQIIEILCEHLYSPGPSRCWDQPAGDKFLQKVYEDNHFDAMMLRADQLSTLNEVAAVQCDVDEGDFAEKPVTLRLWGAQDFHVWTDPTNRTIPKVCVTIDRLDESTEYRIWTDEVVRLYATTEESLALGKVAVFIKEEDHEYGVLPFEFVHYCQPITSFWESGIGQFVVQGEIAANNRLSRVDEAINKHLNPIPIAENVDDNFQMFIEPQRFVKINQAKMRVSSTGGYEEGAQPRLYYLEAHIDIAGAWDDLCKFLNQVLQALRIPAEAVRMEQIGVSSGIALIVEQAPLLTRARARHKPFALYETNIARMILRAAGNHYGKPELVDAAKTGKMTLGWPQPSVPVPTKDNLDLLDEQVTKGYKSMPMAFQEWYGCDREQAFLLMEQIEADNKEMALRVPTLALVRSDQDDDQGGDDEDDDSPAKGESGADDDDEDSDSSELAEAV
jgi:hypothetical protein